MAYAVFKDGETISRTFPTQEEALQRAKEARWIRLMGNLSLKTSCASSRARRIPRSKLTMISTGCLIDPLLRIADKLRVPLTEDRPGQTHGLRSKSHLLPDNNRAMSVGGCSPGERSQSLI
jgi:hypothetical protein